MESILSYDLIFLPGDFKCKVGVVHTSLSIVGRFGIGTIVDYSQRLLMLAANKTQPVRANTFFETRPR
jgi:hypothetical protein